MLETVCLILKDSDITAVSSKPLHLRAPFLENKPPEQYGIDNWVTYANNMEAPEGRLLKTHLPFRYVSHLVNNSLSNDLANFIDKCKKNILLSANKVIY